MPRKPRQKRTYLDDGSMSVAAKNPNGSGSVYYEPPSVRPDGRERAGRARDVLLGAAKVDVGLKATDAVEVFVEAVEGQLVARPQADEKAAGQSD